MSTLRAALVLFVALLSPSLSFAQGGPPGRAPTGPTTVGVITVEKTQVPLTQIVPGRALASATSVVRPRVSGLITEILYEAGNPVQAGQPLFKIEDESFAASLRAAEAALLQAQTARANAQSTLERIERLGASATRVEADSARAALAAAEAALVNSENTLRTATRDLGYTTVTAPLDGIISYPDVVLGDLVTANQAAGLATITRLDPIHIDLTEPAARLMSVRNQIEAGLISPQDSLHVKITLEDGSVHSGAGTLIAPGITVSPSTGTQTMRFAFENPEGRILPGQFVRGEITVGNVEAVLLPQRATSRGNDGSLTAWIVGEGSKTEQRRLTTQGARDNHWIVTSGLDGGEQVLVDGLRNMQLGREVIPTPVHINALGLVEDRAAPRDGQ